MQVNKIHLIAKKIGMTTLYVGKAAKAVTLLKVENQILVGSKEHCEGVSLVKLGVSNGFGKIRNKPQIKEFEKLGKEACKVTREFKIQSSALENLADNFSLEVLEEVKYIDVTSKSVGKGFAGGMKRWGFSGAPASHGASLSHRAIGSTGTREKIWPGKKMPGQMGNKTVTVQNLKIAAIDKDLGIVAVFGAIAGKAGNMVVVRDSIKKQGGSL